ncbi:LytTR family DNA-binding domain-containing protein [Hymenobacter sp. BT770]|uniref:LytR/AlgR family response regulator transcription factor n=1 Tax=Hymenobacter sp. BT770 TaxID=2886942 RepID=UPI001D13030A|nr:LytTR family DNA-binding domain-containing protein [Hymenobacter sp. BT770]MCC3154627.1 LytTR family DNA-binding domain-containing protein [Hymenobacter sp. BT770]MDO3416680.1 LytTR family DNA-binding domain-containing protein [Hymenobacter sp. BT770]
MTILLLEDEYPAAERLQRLLAQAAPEAQVVAVLDTVSGALAWLAAHPAPDLILSDIQLADGLSLEIWEQAVVPSPVIFTTAFDAYAIRAFQANSIAYLLKPVKLAELQAALAKRNAQRDAALNEELRRRNEELSSGNSSFLLPNSSLSIERLLDALPRLYKTRFLVRQGEQLLPLPVADIAWFSSRHETTTLVAADGRRFVLDYTLEQLESLLDPAQFFRLNRQIIAQLPAVRRLHPHFNGKLLVELHPAASEDVLVSREKASAVKAWLEG